MTESDMAKFAALHKEAKVYDAMGDKFALNAVLREIHQLVFGVGKK